MLILHFTSLRFYCNDKHHDQKRKRFHLILPGHNSSLREVRKELKAEIWSNNPKKS